MTFSQLLYSQLEVPELSSFLPSRASFEFEFVEELFLS